MRLTTSVLLILLLGALIADIWLAEDAAITLRAVENVYHTMGPVFNPGESTEVYTHPLWFIVLVLLKGMGLPLAPSAVFLGLILALMGLMLLVTPPEGSAGEPAFRAIYLVIPFLLGSHPGFTQFASSGMELGLVSLLLGFFYLMLERYRPAERPTLLGVLLGLLYLSRPELGLFALWYGVFFLWELLQQKHLSSRQILWRMGKAAGAILMVAGSWHLFRYLYYGELFPNTYYAKAGLDSYWLQGIKYLLHFLLYGPGSWLLILFTVAYAYVIYANPGIFQNEKTATRPWFPLIRDAGAPLLMVLYVVRLGGDFMAFRFLLPELIMLAWLARRFFTIPLPTRWSAFLSQWDAKPVHLTAAFGLLFVAFQLLPVPASRGYIANERFHFVSKFTAGGLGRLTPTSHPWGARGDELSRLQSCLNYRPFRIANSQAEAQCMEGVGLGYVGLAAGPFVEIIDEQGISDAYVARLPVLLRFRPGHEHSISTLEVLAKDVIFCNTGEAEYDAIMNTKFGTVVRWDPHLLQTLPGAESRLKRLVELKTNGSPVVQMMEARYGISAEELLKRSRTWNDSIVEEKRQCWEGDSL